MIVKNLTYKFILFLYFSRFILSTVPGQFILFMLFTRRPYLPHRVWFYLLIVTFYWTVVLCFNFSKLDNDYVGIVLVKVSLILKYSSGNN
jgi:hypothetical protein